MSVSKKIYKFNKNAKVGDELKCPSCGIIFIKETYQQTFCKTKGKTICKDKYWNTVTPEKRCNTTRISPASAAWMERTGNTDEDLNHDYNSIYKDFHPYEGLNDDDYKAH